MTPTITPEALEHAVQAYARAQDMGHNHHDALYSALTSALPEKAASTISGVPDAWANPDNPDDVVSASKLDSLRNHNGAPGKKLAERYTKALYAAPAAAGAPKSYNAGGIELTACQLHEALLMAGDPEFDTDFEDRSRVRIFHYENGHSGPGIYCECVDVEEEGCIKLDGTSPVIRKPAAQPQAEQQGAGDVEVIEAARAAYREVKVYSTGETRSGEVLRSVADLNRNDDAAWRAAITAALAARQPVGEPVGTLSIQHFRGCKSMENVDFDYTGNLDPGSHSLYTAPPAQVDLEQFREAVEQWKLHAQCRQDERVKGIDWNARIAKADELLALIDGKAVRS